MIPKQIIFIISEIDRDIDILSAKLMAGGVDTYTYKESEFNEIRNNNSLSFWREPCLYITDSGSVYNFLNAMGKYVIFYLHDGIASCPAKYAVSDLVDLPPDSLDMAYRRLAGIPWDILKTERLYVRETVPDDVDALYEIFKDPEMTRYTEGLFIDPEEERVYIADYAKNVYEFYGYGIWTVCKKDNSEIIGRAGITPREGYDIPELGFDIGTAFQHQGYAYEVCHAILQYAFEELFFDRIQTFVMPDNTASLNLCKKLGFIYDSDVTLGEHTYKRLILYKQV